MKRLISCEFDIDTACVELKFSDGSMIIIDTISRWNTLSWCSAGIWRSMFKGPWNID